MAKNAFRFGVVTGGQPSREAWTALARRTEEPGRAAFGIELTDGPVAALPAFAGMPVESRPLATVQAVAYLQQQREEPRHLLHSDSGEAAGELRSRRL